MLAPTVMKMMSPFQSSTQLLKSTGPRPGPTTSSLSPNNWNIVGSVVKPVNNPDIPNYKSNPDNKDQRQPAETEVMSESPSLKKSANMKSNETLKDITADNKAETDSDNIQIKIKIGNTLTKISMKKKKKDVKVKLYRDQETQTLQTQTRKRADKRTRENVEEINKNKKIKATSKIYEDSIDGLQNEENEDERSINYYSGLGQMFSTFDADMGNSDKSQSIIEISDDETLAEEQATQITQHSQNPTQKTQRKVLSLSRVGNTIQNVKSNAPPKDSESLFALSNIESQAVAKKGQNQQHGPKTEAQIANLLIPCMCRDLASSHKSHDVYTRQLPDYIPTTLQERDIADATNTLTEETPQKESSYTRQTAASSSGTPPKSQSQLHTNKPQLINDTIVASVAEPKLLLEMPTMNQFWSQIQHMSTPVASKSLNFGEERVSTSAAFTKTRAPSAHKYCVAVSSLNLAEVKTVQLLCTREDWTFVEEYSTELTHLVVEVDKEGRSKRTAKYMCAVAAGCWIVRHEWAVTWLRSGNATEEEPFEALDMTGEPGPKRARTATRKLFDGFTFFCMPPFSMLSEPVLKVILELAGGRVFDNVRDVRLVDDVRDVRVQAADVRLLLAEPGPEHAQEDKLKFTVGGRERLRRRLRRARAGGRPALPLAKPVQEYKFTYLALDKNVVSVNHEWALNCVGSHTLISVLDYLLCSPLLLPAATSTWPPVLIQCLGSDSGDKDERI